MQHLGPGRLVIGVIQSHQRVPQKRSQLPSRRFQLRRRMRCSNLSGQVGFHLQFRMTAGINLRHVSNALAIGEDLPRHLEFAQRLRQRKQLIARRRTMRHFAEAVIKPQQRIQRNQPLVVQHGTNSGRHQLVDLLPCGALLLRPCQHIHQPLLRNRIAARRRQHQSPQRGTGRLKQPRRRRYVRKRLQCLLPRRVQLTVRNLPLASQNLPDPDVRLKSPQSIRPQRHVRYPVDSFCCRQKPRHGLVIQRRELHKH
jgi:hypothetical protein